MSGQTRMILAMFAALAFVLGNGFGVRAEESQPGQDDFSFVQLSDTHWGFDDPKINPDPEGALNKAIDVINRLNPQPDFIVFTGDLTHKTDNAEERRIRMNKLLEKVRLLNVKDIKFIPGEDDAGLDNGETFKEMVGATHYTFDHKGVHFIVLDNASNSDSSLGDEQLQWLAGTLQKFNSDSRIVVFVHRPLFDLYPRWGWQTPDGSKALDLLTPYKNVTVFYGHIHQVDYSMSGPVAMHAAKGMMYVYPAAGSALTNAPVPWNPDLPYDGLGFRNVKVRFNPEEYKITEYPVTGLAAEPLEHVIQITARRYAFDPSEIKIKMGVPVVLELTTLDVKHSFNCPDLGVRDEIVPGKVTRIRIQAPRGGMFVFKSDIDSLTEQGEMQGRITVVR